jgi:peptide/nickel transport system ATP-binding protein
MREGRTMTGTGFARPAPGEPLVRARDLACHFEIPSPLLSRLLERRPPAVLKAVDGIDLDIRRGETFSIVGESGCGKSTVARLLVGLYRPTGGSIEFEGVDLAALRGRAGRAPFHRKVQMIFQDPYASLNPRWRVRDIIAEPIRTHRLIREPAALRRRIDELLRQVGLSPADADRYPHEFSGGQRQRISIARGLASEPEFLVCDEPTSALDVSVQAQILNLLKDLQREYGLTYLFISHNLAVIYHVSDRVAVMYLGRLVEVAEVATLFARPLHPYTRLLLETVPDLEMSGRERQPMAGEVPSPIDPPKGCAFHPRCPFADDRCRRERPLLRRTHGAAVACHAVEEARLPADTAGTPFAKRGA